MSDAEREMKFGVLNHVALVLAFLLMPILCHAQAQTMPAVEGKTLDGGTLCFPATANEKPIVLVFGFARGARDQGVAWGKQLVALQQEKADFSFYQVAMLDGAPKFTHGIIARAIRAEVPPAYYSHMLLLTSGEKDWKKALAVANDDQAYVALCSPSGKIEWQAKGVGEEQFTALRAHLRSDEIASK